MPTFKPGDRVVYQAKLAESNPDYNGETGTITHVYNNMSAPNATVDWDHNDYRMGGVTPYLGNLQHLLAEVTPITTEYEADTHHDDSCNGCPVPPVESSDPVAHPSHYTQGLYEVWRVIRDWKLNFNRGSAVKYIARAGKKDDELQDLRKARQFLDFEIEALEAERKTV